MKAPLNIVVVGGGITGLCAAYYAREAFAKKNLNANLTLVERSPSLGGKIQTLRRDGFVLERGPDSFLSRKKPIMDLTMALGMEEELVATGPYAKFTSILLDGRFHQLPKGLKLGIPTEVTPFLKTGLLSVWGKIRAGMDFFIAPRGMPGDESLGDFLERRLGKQVVERIAEPLLAGIYAGDLYDLSVEATFPRFHELEEKYGSLIRGMMADKKNPSDTDEDLPKIARENLFLTYRNGLGSLVEKLEAALSEVRLLKGNGVSTLEKTEDGYHLLLENGQQLFAHGTILTVPPLEADHLLNHRNFNPVRSVSVANVILAFDKKEIPHRLEASGFLVPRSENRTITACTYTSSKWPHTAPPGKVVLRCYVGRAGDESSVELPDEDLYGLVRLDLEDLMGIRAKPLFYQVNRWRASMPQYSTGHLQELRRMRTALRSTMPGVLLAGAGYNGVGIPDCIRQGKEAAGDLAQFFQGREYSPSAK